MKTRQKPLGAESGQRAVAAKRAVHIMRAEIEIDHVALHNRYGRLDKKILHLR